MLICVLEKLKNVVWENTFLSHTVVYSRCKRITNAMRLLSVIFTSQSAVSETLLCEGYYARPTTLLSSCARMSSCDGCCGKLCQMQTKFVHVGIKWWIISYSILPYWTLSLHEFVVLWIVGLKLNFMKFYFRFYCKK